MTDTAAALALLRRELEATQFPLTLDGREEAERARDSAVRQIDDYVLPRLANLEAPLLVVVGGSTGAGKSTLVNALVGEVVSAAGAIRPTTRQPLLVVNPGDLEWFEGDRILPGLRRVTGPQTDPADALTLLPSTAIPADLALLDAPDIDSVADANRALARQLLEAADLWIFATTAARYADAAAWRVLDEAASRGVTVAVVLGRVPKAAAEEVEADLARMLRLRGLGGAPLFVIHETVLDQHGMLPAEGAVSEVRGWLESIAEDRATRLRIARQTVQGAIVQLRGTTEMVAGAREQQEEALDQMASSVTRHYDRALSEIMTTTTDGSLLRGEVLARWQDFVGTSDVFRSVESWFGGLRDRVSGWFSGQPAQLQQVEEEIESGLGAVIVDRVGEAAADTWREVRSGAAGRGLFDDASLSRESPDARERAADLVRNWQADLLDLVRQETPGKRKRARLLSLGLNAVTVALIMVVFASTGGLLGGEIAIAGGSAVLGQKMLETVFGDQAVRAMAQRAEDLLRSRVEDLLSAEAGRYLEPLESLRQGTSAAELAAVLEALA